MPAVVIHSGNHTCIDQPALDFAHPLPGGRGPFRPGVALDSADAVAYIRIS
jgi:hypothetical protein